MGELVTNPYDTADGVEYVAYLQHVLGECDRLRSEGRLPDSEAVMDFFDEVRSVLHHIRQDVARATARGEQQIVTRLTMTGPAYQRLTSMNESIAALLEILEIRQAIDLQRTEGSIRVAKAVREGTFVG